MKQIIVLLMLLLPLVGCNQPQKAAVQANGNQYVVKFLIDAGVTSDLTAQQAQGQRQVASWMEHDLLQLLTRAGYTAAPINSSADFKGGSGAYLLQVRIANYNPGSKAARMLVGYGAGAASLDIEYQIYNGQQKQVANRNDGVGSGRDWTYCCRTLNERMIAYLGTTVGL